MARNTGPSCRLCRREGIKLFLKGSRCVSDKCAVNRRAYPPGQHGQIRKKESNYGVQLREKQKVRNTYGLREKQFSNYVNDAANQSGDNPTELLYESLESRLDNAVFRSGLAVSRSLARQMVSHGHITVNGRKVTIPSYQLRIGDAIGIREGSRQSKLFAEIGPRLKKHPVPAWLKFNPDELKGEIAGKPKIDKTENSFDLASVIEFYRR